MQETAYGAEWTKTLVGFLPGVQGSTLSSEVSNEVFGGYRGTVPVSLWTSIYHNVGFLGVLPTTIVLMKLIELITHLFLRRMPVTTIHLVNYAFLSFYLAILPVTSPFQIINNGVLAVLLIFLIARVRMRRPGRALRIA